MKIQVIESSSKRPLANTKVQLQVKGKDSGFLSLTTDGTGFITLDEKYNGQQITATSGASANASPSQQGQWMTASEGARLVISAAGSKQRTTETQGGSTK